MSDVKKRVSAYWSKRSESFMAQRSREFHSPLAKRWVREFKRYLPVEENLRVLDIGCGTGFFSGLLARMGYQVTGIDLTAEMIAQARAFAEAEGFDATFAVGDAEALAFDAETFDVVIARNVTWTLPHVEQAYAEWLRVLRPGGLLLNIDGDYGATAMDATDALPENHTHRQLSQATLSESEAIQRLMPISHNKRPEWDVQHLLGSGISTLTVDLTLSSKIYLEVDEFYNPTPLFLLAVTK